ncbi:MAG: hypothetical protein HC795_14055 [Coleofasciculaceae cyanobacterium RL_1_1]|nr:hypothetical protein [Coleofasciculaceae cyanobacterium RL_1_1]
MNFFQFRWIWALVFSLGLMVTGCGGVDNTTEDTVTEPDIEATDSAETADSETADADDTAEGKEDADTEAQTSELTPAPEGTFAASIQAVLMTSFPEQTGFDVELVACPEDVTLESGEPFVCEIQATDGFVTSVDVVTDPETETFDWTTKGLDIRGLEKAIATGMLENMELAGKVDCGLGETKNPFREEAVGSAFECAFTAENGDDQTINVVVNDEEGNVTWNVE